MDLSSPIRTRKASITGIPIEGRDISIFGKATVRMECPEPLQEINNEYPRSIAR